MPTIARPRTKPTAGPLRRLARRLSMPVLATLLATPCAAWAWDDPQPEAQTSLTTALHHSSPKAAWRAAIDRSAWTASVGPGGLGLRADRFGLAQQSQAFSIAVHYRLTRRWSGGLEQEWASFRTMPGLREGEPSGAGWRLDAARSGSTAPLRGLLTWRLNPHETITLRPRARRVMITYRLQMP